MMVAKFAFVDQSDLEEYEAGLKAFLDGGMPEERFTPFRLQMGVYGQRQDGVQMVRIKLPGGVLTPDQMDVIADIVDQYSGQLDRPRLAHITTRQDIQAHFVRLRDTPAILRRLAAAGLTTREACGNTIRNVTSCFLSGVCPSEHADVSVHARRFAEFYLRHPLTQQFPRKFKVSFSGCATDCALSGMHDIGFIATARDGVRGFEVWAAGGLSTQPVSAIKLEEFIEEKELLLVGEALMRVHFKYSDRKHRARARMKYVMMKLGVDKFIELYRTERAAVEKTHLGDAGYVEARWRQPTGDFPFHGDPVVDQHDGQKAVLLNLFRGDLTPAQCRSVAAAARAGGSDDIRTTPEQGIAIAGCASDMADSVVAMLNAAGICTEHARGLSDVVCCPGVESCRLAITNSYGLAETIKPMLEQLTGQDAGLAGIRVKISGCQHSCGQHHIADLGFHGLAKKIEGKAVPHYQLHVGGSGKAGKAFGFATAPVPAKHAPEAGIAVLSEYRENRNENEPLHEWAARLGKDGINTILKPFSAGEGEVEGLMYDWSENQPFSTKDNKPGECAAAVVGMTDALLCEAQYEQRLGNAHLDSTFWAEAMEGYRQSAISTARAFLVTYGEKPEADDQVFGLLAGLAAGDADVSTGLSHVTSALMSISLADPAPGVTRLRDALTPFVDLAARRFAPVPQQESCSPIRETPDVRQPSVDEGGTPLLNLTGVACPMNFVKTKLRLETLPAGAHLEVILDDGEPIENVPRSLREQGHKVLKQTRISDAQWKIQIERSGL